MNIQEKAEQYAREKLGNWCHIVHSAYEISQCTNGEVTVNDYLAGYNEAKRWIPVGERFPECNLHLDDGGKKSELVLVKLKNNNIGIAFSFLYVENDEEIEFFECVNGSSIYDVKEWREI